MITFLVVLNAILVAVLIGFVACLSVRHWTCPECGADHDRDYNASVNIKNFGLATLRMERAEVKPVECPLVDDRAPAPKKQRHREAGKAISKCNLEAAESLAQR